jgi:hypothetical protein
LPFRQHERHGADQRVLLAEVQARQHIRLAVVEGGQLRPCRPQLIGDVAQRLAGLCPVRLDGRSAAATLLYWVLARYDSAFG